MTFQKKIFYQIFGATILFLPLVANAEGTDANSKNLEASINKINAQINNQQKTIAKLKSELHQLKTAQQDKNTIVKAKMQKDAQIKNASPNPILSEGATPVITAPYLGVAPRWDAADLIVNQPNYQEDILLMQRDNRFDKELSNRGLYSNLNPILEISGKVEGQAYDTKPFNGSSSNNINISGAELDFVTHVSKWVNGMISMNYDKSAPNSNGGQTNAQLTSNSRVYVSQAFATIGNLSLSPFYSTLGYRTLPYGEYNTSMISDTYPKMMFRINDPSLLLGYYPKIGEHGFYFNAFTLKGDTGVNQTPSRLNNGGADAGYLIDNNGFKGDVGISAIANVADSNGMQANGLSGSTEFQGFGYAPVGANEAAEILHKRVPGLNAHISLSKNDYTIIAEGNTATTEFNPSDLAFNNHGAKPAAAHIEGVYSFNIHNIPSSFALGYDHTWQALALAIPEQRYIATWNISYFKNTITALEFKREINYKNAGNNGTASGQGLNVVIPGHYANTLTAQFGYYF